MLPPPPSSPGEVEVGVRCVCVEGGGGGGDERKRDGHVHTLPSFILGELPCDVVEFGALAQFFDGFLFFRVFLALQSFPRLLSCYHVAPIFFFWC